LSNVGFDEERGIIEIKVCCLSGALIPVSSALMAFANSIDQHQRAVT